MVTALSRRRLFWGIIRFVKQACLSVITIAFWWSPMAQAFCAVLVLIVVASEHSRLGPCLADVCNKFELAGLMNCVLVVVIGIILTLVRSISDERRREQTFEASLAFQVVFFVLQGTYFIAALFVTAADSRDLANREFAAAAVRRAAFDLPPAAQDAEQDEKSDRDVNVDQADPATRPRVHRTDPVGQVEDSVVVDELMLTFRGRILKSYVNGATFGADPLAARSVFVTLGHALAPYVADSSSINNYSECAWTKSVLSDKCRLQATATTRASTAKSNTLFQRSSTCS